MPLGSLAARISPDAGRVGSRGSVDALAAIGCCSGAVGLSGCAAAERTISEFVPDHFRGLPALGLVPVQQDRPTERAVPRPKAAKPPKPEPVAVAPPELSSAALVGTSSKALADAEIHAATERIVQAPEPVRLHGASDRHRRWHHRRARRSRSRRGKRLRTAMWSRRDGPSH